MTLVSCVDEDRHVRRLLRTVGDPDRLAGGVEHRRLADELVDAGIPASRMIWRPSSALVPSRRITIGARSSTRPSALDDAVGDLLAAGDAAEDVDEDRAHVLVVVDDLERAGHHVGVGAAADVEEVGGRAADLVDDVERAHGQAGAVGDDADRAVEPDVLQALLLGQLLAVVEHLGRLVLGPLGVAELGVVVEADLGVEGVDLAGRLEDQRVDLGQVAVALDEAARRAARGCRRRRRAALGSSLGVDGRLRGPSPRTGPSTGSMCSLTMASGSFVGDLLDLDAALRPTASAGAAWPRGRA